MFRELRAAWQAGGYMLEAIEAVLEQHERWEIRDNNERLARYEHWMLTHKMPYTPIKTRS